MYDAEEISNFDFPTVEFPLKNKQTKVGKRKWKKNHCDSRDIPEIRENCGVSYVQLSKKNRFQNRTAFLNGIRPFRRISRMSFRNMRNESNGVDCPPQSHPEQFDNRAHC